MSIRYPALMVLAICLASPAPSPSIGNADYTKEAFVIQDMTTEVSFSLNGAREWRQKLSVRVQSEGTLRQFGVLSFPYNSANEDIDIQYVRVTKADGSIVETPKSNMVDTTAEIATLAPTYSDLKQKQIPVKALGVGDVLEYEISSSQRKPEVAGQFWYEQDFPQDAVILKASLDVSVPKETLLKISSPTLKYENHEDTKRRSYRWTYSQLAPTKQQDDPKQAAQSQPAKVSLSTFKNWEEVGYWWETLAAPEAAVTPAIQQKARELTAGLATDGDKARAIYKYVSMKFRYISISFGAGRYRPHTAEEVLSNQYGDCKDKHTLFTALLRASGIRSWPALVGVGIKFDSEVPSPSQFNHVITVLPEDGKNVWLDTTAEVAPFGLLGQSIRDEEALVIPTGGKPFLVKTPADPPFRTSETIDVKSSLAENGVLTGHFDIQLSGDNAVLFRSGFRQVAPTQWQALAQQMSLAMSYGGEVKTVEIENLDDLDKPFRCTYDYTRKKYSAWEDAQITPPLPPISFGPGDEAEKPKEAFWAGTPGESIYRASVALPKGFVIDPPQNVSLTTEFADYSAQYLFKQGTLFTERKITIKRSKVTLDQWANYQQFARGLRADQTQLLPIGKADELGNAEPASRPTLLKAPRPTPREDGEAPKTDGRTATRDAESLVSISLTKLADSYRDNGSQNIERVYSQWKAESADLLTSAVSLSKTQSGARPEVLALALEMQALQASDQAARKKLRDEAEEIRGRLTREILPSPVRNHSLGGPPVRPLGDLQPPTLLQRVEPSYSDAAREARIEGKVHLAIVVEEDGTPSSVYLVEGLGFGLDEEAAKAVKQWRFLPGMIGGKAVRVQARIEVAFKLL